MRKVRACFYLPESARKKLDFLAENLKKSKSQIITEVILKKRNVKKNVL